MNSKPYTGGALNQLNGMYGVSAPQNSVPVMKLLRKHSPKTRQELADCIEYHYKNNCECGIKSQGTVQDFGKILYECQMLAINVPNETMLNARADASIASHHIVELALWQ